MKQTFTSLVSVILLFSVYSCSKDSSSTTTTPATTANVASFGGTTEDFSAATTYTSRAANSISFTGSTSTVANTGDNINLSLMSRSSQLVAGTYNSNNAADLTIYTKVGNNYYYSSWTDTTNTITINAIDSLTISGSYKATVFSQADSLKKSPKILSGNFKK